VKNIVILVDGTWNDGGTDQQERSLLTNVVWLRDLCCDNEKQTVWYDEGVGTDGGLDKLLGGALGLGLTRGICAAYRAACERYQPGDRLYFFGFSRGAYTVRTAADMVAAIGLADLSNVPETMRDTFCRKLFDVYRGKTELSKLAAAKFFNAETAAKAGGTTPIHLVGVWDTVGTAGIPDHYVLLNKLDRVSKRHNWANTELSPVVLNGRHAVGMDEQRESFVPALWTNKDGNISNDERIKQLWFCGVHTDVGGGYEHRDLGNIAMGWMAEEAQDLGLLLKENPDRPIPKERAMGVVNDSLQSVFKHMWTRPRGVPNVHAEENAALFHPSVLRRYQDPQCPSRPDWRAAKLDPEETVWRSAWAKDRWSPLGVYCDPEKNYEISAEGTWYDKDRAYDPAGTWLNKSKMPLAAALNMHGIPNWISKLSGKTKGGGYRRVWGSWRVPDSKPFVLMGVIADGVGVTRQGEVTLPDPHRQFEIGAGVRIGPGTAVELQRGGYLYCFPNDVWSFYKNNRGHITVAIKRT